MRDKARRKCISLEWTCARPAETHGELRQDCVGPDHIEDLQQYEIVDVGTLGAPGDISGQIW